MAHTHNYILAIALLVLSVSACGEDAQDNPFSPASDPTKDIATPDPVEGQDSDDDGWLDELEAQINTDYLAADEPCASQTYSIQETFQKPIADFLFVIDSSGSMREELPRIKQGLQEFFRPLLSNPELDFRVILIVDSDAAGGFCLDGDSGELCQNGLPSQSDRFLYYHQRVNSSDALNVVLRTFRQADSFRVAPFGWQEFIREEAQFVLTVITDDASGLSAEMFINELNEIDTAHKITRPQSILQDVTVHSIVGMSDEIDWTLQPDAPVQTKSCATAPKPGVEYQRLSKQTGGLRFSVCRSSNYGAMLEQSARAVIDSGYIPCVFSLPPAQDQSYISTSEHVGIQLEPEGQSPHLLTRVSNASQCDQGDFYIQRASYNSSSIHLCPTRCEEIQSSKNITLKVATSCVETACSQGLPTHTGRCD